ncbi:MAG: hypothetical protein FJX56_13380 [Alphaproteobacteria bacterium]|nr:hypothetical protein [Alphaproteobacteria bacterium]
MLSAQESLEFLLFHIERLRGSKKAHDRATYVALMNMTQRWAEPTDQYIDDSLAMAERIGQDLADISRTLTDLQHSYLKALFGGTEA